MTISLEKTSGVRTNQISKFFFYKRMRVKHILFKDYT